MTKVHRSHPNRTRHSKASLIILIVLALLLMVAAIFLVYNLPSDEPGILSGETEPEPQEASIGFDAEPAAAQRLHPFGDGLYQVTENRIVRLDNHGHEEHAVDVDFNEPFARSENGYFWAGDRDGHRFVLLDEHGEIHRGITEGRISSASISPEGYLAIVQDQVGSTGLVSVHAPDSGDKLFDAFFPESGYVLSVALSQAQTMDVALLNTHAASPVPIIKRFDLEGREIGQRLPDFSEIFPLVLPSDQSQIVLASAVRLLALSYEHEDILWQETFHQLHAVSAVRDGGFLVVAAEGADSHYSLFHITTSGDRSKLTDLGEPTQALATRNGRGAIGSGRRVMAGDLDAADSWREWTLPAEVIRLDFASDSAIIVITRGGVRRLEMGS